MISGIILSAHHTFASKLISSTPSASVLITTSSPGVKNYASILIASSLNPYVIKIPSLPVVKR